MEEGTIPRRRSNGSGLVVKTGRRDITLRGYLEMHMARSGPLHACAAIFCASLILAALCAASSGYAQQPWPSKPVRMIIPNSTGAAPDLIARVLADQMTRALGQPWLVDNRPGGEELIAAEAVARAAPDGYTLLLVSQSFVAVNPNTLKSMPVDPARDFIAVAVVIDTTPIAIGVTAGLPARSLGELISLAKSQPGKLSYGVTVPILAMVGDWLGYRAGIQWTQITYKATAQQIADTVSGTVQVIISNLLTLSPLAKAGKLRIVAVTSPNRVEGFEDVPSVMETFPDVNVGGGLVLLAPLGTRADIVQRLNRETDTVVRSGEFAKRVAEFGWANRGGARTPQETAEYIRAQRERWSKVVKDLGLQPK